MKKFISDQYKDRTLILIEPIGETSFDKNGVFEIKEEHEEILLQFYPNIKPYDGKISSKKTKTDLSAEKKDDLPVKDQTDLVDESHGEEIDDDDVLTDDQKKELAIKNIVEMKSIKDLRELASQIYDENEWKDYKTKEELKNYLISKL